MNDPQPSSNDSLEVDALRRVVAACEQFEAEWRGGRAPELESYLERVEPGQRRKLFALLLAIEVEQRVQRGQNPTYEQYRAQYPDRAQDLALVFSPDAVALAGVELGLAPTVAVAMAAPDLTEMGSSPSAPSGEPATVFFAGRDPQKILHRLILFLPGSAATR